MIDNIGIIKNVGNITSMIAETAIVDAVNIKGIPSGIGNLPNRYPVLVFVLNLSK
jgi:hypothetical protein